MEPFLPGPSALDVGSTSMSADRASLFAAPESQLAPSDPCDAGDTDRSSLSSGQQALLLGAVGGLAGYLLYAIHTNARGVPHQMLRWGGDGDGIPEVLLINFPDEVAQQLREAAAMLLANVRFVPAEAVIYDDSGAQATPTTIIGGVQQSVRAAFAQHGGCRPCVVYGESLSVRGEGLNLFGDPEAVVRELVGELCLHRHCLGFTVDGKHVQLLQHDVRGVVDQTKRPTAAMPRSRVPPSTIATSTACSSIERRVVACIAPHQMTFLEDEVFRSHCDLSPTVSLYYTSSVCRFAGTSTDSFTAWWNSTRPLFALFAAVARYDGRDGQVGRSWRPSLRPTVTVAGMSLPSVSHVMQRAAAWGARMWQRLSGRVGEDSAAREVDESPNPPGSYTYVLRFRFHARASSDGASLTPSPRVATEIAAYFPQMTLVMDEEPQPADFQKRSDKTLQPYVLHWVLHHRRCSPIFVVELLFHQVALLATAGASVWHVAAEVVVDAVAAVPTETSARRLWPCSSDERDRFPDAFSPAQYFKRYTSPAVGHRLTDAAAFAWLQKSSGAGTSTAEAVANDSRRETVHYVITEYAL